MKKVIRMIVFSSIAFFATVFWNKGLNFDFSIQNSIIAVSVVTLMFYIIKPITKLILLPINFFTFGIVAFVVNMILFVFLSRYFHVFTITSWTLQGITIGYWINVALVALSISIIINLLESYL